ncbi:hypothetical protein [Limosilactobacillus reuteri]|uniref:hypothetical protein n=1 Tax=Limosilactobacillus reuteri TaxID=1598 RepID=UPI001E58CFDD|nr:hypothetical protein [Limosilactobacillus reuteri]MCC4459618.1 hypothetical protein [Limosilactobacillus reuteri]MCC4463487.1 hypothetical protein [Limosilactobacillus reuteri]
MSFFSRRKLSEQEPNNYQQQLNEFKYKITKFEDRLDKLENDLEYESQGESFQPANGIDAKEAANQVEKAAQKALPNELKKAFDEINLAVKNEQQSVRLFQYELGAYVCANGKPQRKRIYHINALSKELKKYGYETKLDSNDSDGPYSFLEVSWEGEETSDISKIDPAKKYILPLEGTDREITDSVTGKTISHEVAYACPRDDKWKIIYDRKICSDAVIVPGKEIIDVPKWVRAIEPIEIEC